MNDLQIYFGDAPEPDPRFATTHYLCEATDCEKIDLWAFWAKGSPWSYDQPRRNEERVAWVQTNPGYVWTIGHVDKRPIVIHVRWNWIDGALVAFWELTSQLADYVMADQWLAEKFQKPFASANAMNFHNIVDEIHRRQRA